MKIIYESPRDKQYYRNEFTNLDIFEYSDECYSYSKKYEKYMKYDDIDEGVITNMCKCNSVKEAVKIINKSNVPKGTEFYLWNKYKNKGARIIK